MLVSVLLIPFGLSLVGCNEESTGNTQTGQSNRQANQSGKPARTESEQIPQEVKEPASLDPRDSIDPQTGLCKAVYKQKMDDVIYFVKRYPHPHHACAGYPRMNPKTYEDEDVSPAYMALKRMNAAIFRVLIENSAVAGNTKIHNYEGNSFLHAAALLQDTESLELLAQRSSKMVDIQNDAGFTPIMFAARQVNGPQLAEILVKYGADPHQLHMIEGMPCSIMDFALPVNKDELLRVLGNPRF